MLITPSSYAVGMLCPRRYYWRYRRGIGPAELPFRLLVGRFFHQGLAELLKGKPVDEVIAAITPSDPSEADACVMATWLLQRYAEFDEPCPGHPVYIEKIVKMKMAHGVWAACRVDAIIQDQSGDYWIFETKTTRDINQDYLDKVNLDCQLSFQTLLVTEALDIPVRGVIYNVIGTPRKYRRVDESLPVYLNRILPDYRGQKLTYFARQRALVSPRLIEEKRREILVFAAAIRRWAHTIWPKNDAVCFLRERPCPYRELCMHGPTARVLSAYKPAKPFEELEEGADRTMRRLIANSRRR